MNSYRDTWEYKLYAALRDVMDHTGNYDDIPCKYKENAEKLMDEWASEQIRKMAEKMEDLPE
jgi:uncharacterized lipoprotein YehR (DUF1307 family)